MDRKAGNAAFSPAVLSPAIESGSKDRPIAFAAAFLTSGVSAGVLLAGLFEKNILSSLWPNKAELAIAAFSLLVAAAFLLVEKRRKIAEGRLICRNLTGSDDTLQVVVRDAAGASELASAFSGARRAFEKAALLKAAIEGHGAVLPEESPRRKASMRRTVCVCSSRGRKFQILCENDGGRRILILTSPTRKRRTN